MREGKGFRPSLRASGWVSPGDDGLDGERESARRRTVVVLVVQGDVVVEERRDEPDERLVLELAPDVLELRPAGGASSASVTVGR